MDWLPGRGNSWNFGLQVPLEPHMGKTRPRVTDTALPRGRKPRAPASLAPEVEAAMAEVRKAMIGGPASTRCSGGTTGPTA